MDANLIGIVFGDAEGHVTDANDAFLRLTGYSLDNIINDHLSWPALTPVERHQRQIQALDEIVTLGRCVPFESELIRKNGTRVPVLIGAVRLSARRREGVAFVMDLTDRERRVGQVRLELACADALAGGTDVIESGQSVLQVLLTGLSLRSSALWSATRDGCRLIARLGGPDDEPGFDSLVERVLATAETSWASEDDALATPLKYENHCYGALVLAGWPEGRPEQELVDLCERVAARIAARVARQAASDGR